jgi:N-methylhydantoinase B
VRLVTASLVHVADLGGMAPGGLPTAASDVYQEGLLLPPVRLVREGEVDEQLAAIIRANSRAPERVWGDVQALIAATVTGGRRLEALLDRHGVDQLAAVIDSLLDYTERRTRAGIAALPDGSWHAEYPVDDDGVAIGVARTVRVCVSVRGDEMEFDFTGTDAQVAAPINAARSQVLSAVVYASRCFVDATIPLNDGAFRPLHLVLPEGSLVNPRPPAAVSGRMMTVLAVIEAVLDARSQVGTLLGTAPSAIHSTLIASGQRGGGGFWMYMDNDFGGTGARQGVDGVDGAGPHILGGRPNVLPVESIEMEYPVRFEEYRLRPDSGGAGRWRGGMGLCRTVRVLGDAHFTVRADRVQNPPPGRQGGHPGAPGGWLVDAATPEERHLLAKAGDVRLRAGQTLTMLTSGGGGWGEPGERDPAALDEDVREGRVSPRAERDVYGTAAAEPAAS